MLVQIPPPFFFQDTVESSGWSSYLPQASYLVNKRLIIPQWVLVSILMQFFKNKKLAFQVLQDVLKLKSFVHSSTVSSKSLPCVFEFWDQCLRLILSDHYHHPEGILQVPLKRFVNGTSTHVHKHLQELSVYLISSFFLEKFDYTQHICYQNPFQRVWTSLHGVPKICLSTVSGLAELITGDLFWYEDRSRGQPTHHTPPELVSLNPDVLMDLKKKNFKKGLYFYLFLEYYRAYVQRRQERVRSDYEPLEEDTQATDFFSLKEEDIIRLGRILMDHGVLTSHVDYPTGVRVSRVGDTLQTSWLLSRFSYQAYDLEQKVADYLHALFQRERAICPSLPKPSLKPTETHEEILDVLPSLDAFEVVSKSQLTPLPDQELRYLVSQVQGVETQSSDYKQMKDEHSSHLDFIKRLSLGLSKKTETRNWIH